MKVAASVSLLALAVYWFGSTSDRKTYTTAFGETKTVVLPDETKVIMNANSRITISTDWEKEGVRELELEGEAFFDVQKLNSGQHRVPFRVLTGELAVEVLGTEFNVHSRRGATKVMLSSGKVKLDLPKNSAEDIYMNPGDVVAYTPSQQSLVKTYVDPETFVDWRKNWLVFEGTSLSEVKEVIEDQYGYSVTIEDMLLEERRFTGRYPIDKLDLMLEGLELSLDIEVVKDGNDITVRQKQSD